MSQVVPENFQGSLEIEEEDDVTSEPAGPLRPLGGRTVVSTIPKRLSLRERLARDYADVYSTKPCACCFWKRGRFRPCACLTYKCGCCFFGLLAIALLAVVIGVSVDLVNTHTGSVASILLAKPTVKDAMQREAALVDANKNWCMLSIKMLVVPPSCGRVVLVALNGTGGDELRMYLEAATRITTSIPQCMHGFDFKLDLGKPVFVGECTGMSFAANHLLVKFWDWDRAVVFPHYDPTHAVFLLRNPLEAAVAAYYELVKCGDISEDGAPHALRARSADCGGIVHDSAFETATWPKYAMNYAEAFVDAVNDTQKDIGANRLVLFYEDLVNLEPELQRVLDFVRPVFGSNLADSKRMLRCVIPFAPLVSTTTRVAFRDEALFKAFCDRVRPVWNHEKWGNACG